MSDRRSDVLPITSNASRIFSASAKDVSSRKGSSGVNFSAMMDHLEKLPKGAKGGDVRVHRVELRRVRLQHSSLKLPE